MSRRYGTVVALSVMALVAAGLGGAPSATASPTATGERSAADEPSTETVDLTVVEEAGAAEPGALAEGGSHTERADGSEAGPESPEDEAEPGPADPDVPTAEPEDGATDDPAVVGLTEPLDVAGSDVVVLGVTWEPTDAEVLVDIRVAIDGDWGEWSELHVDPVDPRSPGDGGRPGTEPFILTEGDRVQARLISADGNAPAGARLDVVHVDVRPEDTAGLGSGGGRGNGSLGTSVPLLDDLVATAAPTALGPAQGWTGGYWAPQPSIRLRSSWNAKAPGPMDQGVVRGVTVHHTAGTNDYSQAQVPAILRGIQTFHMEGRGWSDIGYNFLVDRFGGIWEGRGGGILNTTKGVHASSYNGVTSGMSVIGNFETVTVPSKVRYALSSLIAWKLALHGVAADGAMTNFGNRTPVVIGHRDVPDAATACPGRHLYALLPTLRKEAAAKQSVVRTAIEHDLTGDGVPDVFRWSGSSRHAYEPELLPVGARSAVGTGWRVMDLVTSGPALRGGQTIDLVAREAATGRLYSYRGDGKGGFVSGRTRYGLGWGAMSYIVAPGDWNGDGHSDVLAVEAASGALWLYPGDGTGGLGKRTQIGKGWGAVAAVGAAGDFTGDGVPDLAAVMAGTGELRIYPGDGSGGFRKVRSLGRGWDGYDAVVGVVDLTGDGVRDLILRHASTGRMATVAGNGSGGARSVRTWGSGWDAMGPVMDGSHFHRRGEGALISVAPNGRLVSYRAQQRTAFSRGPSLPVDTSATARAVIGDVTGSGAADIITRDVEGRLWLHEVDNRGGMAAPRQVGRGWNVMETITAAGDFDFDGTPDVLALRTDGELWVYPFSPGGNGFGSPFRIGTGFGSYHVLGVGGWSRSSGADVIAVHKTSGQMRLFVGTGRGGLKPGVTIGKGWQVMSDVVALGDVLGNGNTDLLAREQGTGRHWIYPGNGSGGFAPRVPVTSGLPSTGGLA